MELDIFTALLGENAKKISQAKSFQRKDKAEKYITEKEEVGGILEDKIKIDVEDSNKEENDQEKICNHNNWSMVDNKYINGITLNCKKCNNWVIIKMNNNDVKLFVKNLNEKECSSCNNEIIPKNEKINYCKECECYYINGKKIDLETIKQINNINEVYNIETNGESDKEKNEDIIKQKENVSIEELD